MFKKQTNPATKSRIYAIGFHRCGTTSLHKFFKKSGISSIHSDAGKLASRMQYNFSNNLPIYQGYEKYQAFTDIRIVGSHELSRMGYCFRAIVKQDPDALFILNTRNIDNWINSMTYFPNILTNEPRFVNGRWKHTELKHIDRYALGYNLKSRYQAELHLRTRWHANMASVRHYFPKDRLLIFDIERDDPVKLCNFLGLDIKYSHNWGKHNESIVYIGESKLWKIFKCITPQIIKNMFSPTFRRKINIRLLRRDKNAIVRN